MYLTWSTSKIKGKIYKCPLLRESYRENGISKKRTIANLSHGSIEEISAIDLALKHKDDLTTLISLDNDLQLQEGQSIGAVWTLYSMAKRLGVEKALTTSRQGKLALWQVIARALDQGSRLSAVRLAQFHAAIDILGLDKKFDEDDLYANLDWLAKNQAQIETRLLEARRPGDPPQLFLYDVTSSYLEGTKNEWSDWGYNRDKKKGKQQIVIGLLCDEKGEPVSVQVFPGNTQDTKTFHDQIHKVSTCFGAGAVTFVGDRGMIKSPQIKELQEYGGHYITAITRAQIETLITSGVLQLSFFDEQLCEVEAEGIRYILHRNPKRALEIEASRDEKLSSMKRWITKANTYLAEHGKAIVEAARKKLQARISRLKINTWLKLRVEGRVFDFEIDSEALTEASRLDGCYAIKTDLPPESASTDMVHSRYKDLAMVEEDFRMSKTGHLQVRPVFLRNAQRTEGHVLVVMLASVILRELRRGWSGLDVTAQEGLDQLSTLCSQRLLVPHRKIDLHKIPEPREMSRRLLMALDVNLPPAFPSRGIAVVTKKKLPSRRIRV